MAESKAGQLVYGVFKGMGDLLWAVPAICCELDRGHQVHLLLFPGSALVQFCSLIDWGSNSSRLHIHQLPSSIETGFAFLRTMARLSPNAILISPHAPATDASWRIPVALWLMRHLLWGRKSALVAADSERFAHLFDRRLPIDRTQPLKFREWSFYSAYRDEPLPRAVAPRFIREIAERCEEDPRYDLVIHPGANAATRLWPADKYRDTLSLLPTDWKVAVVGLPLDVEHLRAVLPADRQVEYISGSLRLSLQTLASARRLLVMDSGNLHFAEALSRPAVAVFGKENPATIVRPGVVKAVYKQSAPCQPCGKSTCSQPEMYCMTRLPADLVASQLVLLAAEVPAAAPWHVPAEKNPAATQEQEVAASGRR